MSSLPRKPSPTLLAIQALLNANPNLTTTLNELQFTIQATESRHAELLEEKENYISRLQVEGFRSRSEVGKLDQKVTEAENKISEVKKEHDVLVKLHGGEVAALKEEAAKFMKKHESDIIAIKEKGSAVQREYDECAAAKDQITQDLLALQKRYEKDIKVVGAVSKAELTTLQEKYAKEIETAMKLKAEFETCQQKSQAGVAAAKSELFVLQKRLTDTERVRDHFEKSMKEREVSLSTEREAKEKMRLQLNNEISKVRDENGVLGKEKEEILSQLDHEIAEKTALHTDHNAKLLEQAQLRVAVDQLNAEIQRLNNENAVLKKNLNDKVSGTDLAASVPIGGGAKKRAADAISGDASADVGADSAGTNDENGSGLAFVKPEFSSMMPRVKVKHWAPEGYYYCKQHFRKKPRRKGAPESEKKLRGSFEIEVVD